MWLLSSARLQREAGIILADEAGVCKLHECVSGGFIKEKQDRLHLTSGGGIDRPMLYMKTSFTFRCLAAWLMVFAAQILPSLAVTFTNYTRISFNNANYEGAEILVT